MIEIKRDDVKNCPFCGGKAAVRLHGYLAIGACSYSVQCAICGAATAECEQEKTAIGVWNRRTAE